MREEIAEAKKSIHELEREKLNILGQPFFKREHDTNNLDKLTSLEKQITQEELALKKSRDSILKWND